MSDDTKLRSNSRSEVHKRQRSKNYAMLAVLLFLVALIWIVTMVKLIQGSAA